MSAITDAEVAEWRSAVGRTLVREERLSIEALRRFALAIGADPEVERVQPVLAHWAYFLDAAPDDELGEDGHPRRGGFLPNIPLPRRMFAGADVALHASLELEQPAEMTLKIAEVSHKRGRSGDLVFVEVERTLAQAGGVKVEERQSLVYRAIDPAPTPLPVPAEASLEGELWSPTTTNLFRFSAVTFNGHRIHYDQPYTTQVEGYPALVVHGPFAAARLAQFAGRERPLARFAFRAAAPLFAGQPVRLRHAGEGEVQAVRCDGVVSTSARITYR